jgi:CheY-like chemotaxis protein/HPt (histidine-containing phosphotransfer) domain-containing protein/PAS domain-containing protein
VKRAKVLPVLVLCLVVFVFLIPSPAPAADNPPILHFPAVRDKPATVDRILPEASRRAGYEVTAEPTNGTSVVIDRRLSLYEANPQAFVLLCCLLLLALFVVTALIFAVEIFRRKNRHLLEAQHTAEELLSRDRELLDARERLEIALASSSSGVWEIDFDNGVVTCDTTVEDMLRLGTNGSASLEEFMEKLRGEDPDSPDLPDRDFVGNETPDTVIRVCPGEEERYCQRHCRVIRGADGRVARVVGMLIDITSRARMEKELRTSRDAAEAASQAKSNFLSGVSHELKTPMNAVIGMSGLLLTENLTERQMKYVNNIHTSSMALLSLIEDILDIAAEPQGRNGLFLRLPPAACDKNAPGDAAEAFVTAPTARVLVVDDNGMNLDVVAGMLRLHGIDCEAATSGMEALEKIARARAENAQYDLVFMDHMMPKMDGIETTLRIRGSGDGLVIVALTANSVEGVKEALIASGMNDYLAKPIREDLLNDMLRKWLPKEKIVDAVSPYGDIGGDGATETSDLIQTSGLIRRLNELGELDLQSSLRRVNGMVEVYEQSVGIVARRMPEVVDTLRRCLEEKQIKNFAIEVHGMKSSLANIGAMALSEKARLLEAAAKRGDVAFCDGNTPPFLEELRALSRKLDEALSEENRENADSKEAGSTGDLKEKLTATRTLINSFSDVEAADIVREMQKFDYGSDVNMKLKKLMNCILEFDYDGTGALIDQLTEFAD